MSRPPIEPASPARWASCTLWASDGTTPVNFVKPRESKPVANPQRRRVMIYGSVAALVLGVVIYAAVSFVGERQAELVNKRTEKFDLEKRSQGLAAGNPVHGRGQGVQRRCHSLAR